ncbi:7045_t:CDS:2, partial [Scutellospora calospora]
AADEFSIDIGYQMLPSTSPMVLAPPTRYLKIEKGSLTGPFQRETDRYSRQRLSPARSPLGHANVDDRSMTGRQRFTRSNERRAVQEKAPSQRETGPRTPAPQAAVPAPASHCSSTRPRADPEAGVDGCSAKRGRCWTWRQGESCVVEAAAGGVGDGVGDGVPGLERGDLVVRVLANARVHVAGFAAALLPVRQVCMLGLAGSFAVMEAYDRTLIACQGQRDDSRLLSLFILADSLDGSSPGIVEIRHAGRLERHGSTRASEPQLTVPSIIVHENVSLLRLLVLAPVRIPNTIGIDSCARSKAQGDQRCG